MIVSQGWWLSLPVREPLKCFRSGSTFGSGEKLTPSWFPDLVTGGQLEPVVGELPRVVL